MTKPRSQDGDPEALKKLVARWYGRLRRHAWYLTHDREVAEDIVQDAWLDIIRTIRRLKEPASFRGWAYRIVGNKAADWVRRRKRQRNLVREVAFHRRNVSNQPSLERDADGMQSLLRQVIKTLPMKSRLVLSMKYVDRMSTREIADSLGIPVGTIKSRLHHAREQLKQAMERIRQ